VSEFPCVKKSCNTSYPLFFSFNHLVLVQMSYYPLSAFPDTSIFLPLCFFPLFSFLWHFFCYYLLSCLKLEKRDYEKVWGGGAHLDSSFFSLYFLISYSGCFILLHPGFFFLAPLFSGFHLSRMLV